MARSTIETLENHLQRRYEGVARADSLLVRVGRIVFQSIHYKLEAN